MLSQNKKSSKIKSALLLLLIIAIGGGIVLILEWTGTTHIFHKRQKSLPVVTASQDTKGEGLSISANSEAGNTTTSKTSTDEPGDTKSNTGNANEAATLLAPSGNFVSAHNVPSDAPIASVCNTTPGATCTITFTNGSVKKNLPSQTTDRGGSTYWNEWTAKSIGLTVGSWQISASASLNGVTQSSSDVMPLVVKS